MVRFFASLTTALLLLTNGIASSATLDAASVLPADFVVRANYKDISDIARLADYDVYEYNNLKQHYVLVAVDHDQYNALLAAGWRLEVDSNATAKLNPENLRGILD